MHQTSSHVYLCLHVLLQDMLLYYFHPVSLLKCLWQMSYSNHSHLHSPLQKQPLSSFERTTYLSYAFQTWLPMLCSLLRLQSGLLLGVS